MLISWCCVGRLSYGEDIVDSRGGFDVVVIIVGFFFWFWL